MKKIWNLLEFVKEWGFVIFDCLCIIIVVALIERNHRNKTVEFTNNIDSIKIVNSRIEYELIKLDSVKNEEIDKVDSIDNNDAINQFWWLLSK